MFQRALSRSCLQEDTTYLMSKQKAGQSGEKKWWNSFSSAHQMKLIKAKH